jgi:hypothetical protein
MAVLTPTPSNAPQNIASPDVEARIPSPVIPATNTRSLSLDKSPEVIDANGITSPRIFFPLYNPPPVTTNQPRFLPPAPSQVSINGYSSFSPFHPAYRPAAPQRPAAKFKGSAPAASGGRRADLLFQFKGENEFFQFPKTGLINKESLSEPYDV